MHKKLGVNKTPVNSFKYTVESNNLRPHNTFLVFHFIVQNTVYDILKKSLTYNKETFSYQQIQQIYDIDLVECEFVLLDNESVVYEGMSCCGRHSVSN